MLPPRKVKFWAKKKENENYAFRTFLKMNADEQKLDEQFLKLHQELFRTYDCSKCRNCCKAYHGSIPEEDVQTDAQYLDMTMEQFIEDYLDPKTAGEGYRTKHTPCDFFDQESRECILGDCKPENCKKYPYTDQPERLQSMLSILESAEICPVVFEMLERLKEEYGFEYRR